MLPTVYQGMYNAITRWGPPTELSACTITISSLSSLSFPEWWSLNCFLPWSILDCVSMPTTLWVIYLLYRPCVLFNISSSFHCIPSHKLAGGLLTGRYKYSDLESQPEGRFFSDAKWSTAWVALDQLASIGNKSTLIMVAENWTQGPSLEQLVLLPLSYGYQPITLSMGSFLRMKSFWSIYNRACGT